MADATCSVKIAERGIDSEGTLLREREVVVKGNSLKTCESIARKIWKEELK